MGKRSPPVGSACLTSKAQVVTVSLLVPITPRLPVVLSMILPVTRVSTQVKSLFRTHQRDHLGFLQTLSTDREKQHRDSPHSLAGFVPRVQAVALVNSSVSDVRAAHRNWFNASTRVELSSDYD
ncbi:unnamed protein product [Phytophthora fragariaefolia]|uniref:Unnamed protein product n=1 Tax=Phytophthora fragariaefolia TaxID=1490495 RepID=A0A9W6XR91_9STRA|nr:unnamed protein product [Phytophthora fragariaefolia]